MNETNPLNTTNKPTVFSIFEATPGINTMLLPNAPTYTLVAASNDFFTATGLHKEQVIGKGYFEVFPETTVGTGNEGEHSLKHSFDYILQHKMPHKVDNVRQAITTSPAGSVLENYWQVRNVPVLNNAGEVQYIIHSLTGIAGKPVEGQEADAAMDVQVTYEKLQQSEETLNWFKFMADNAKDPFILMRRDGSFAYINKIALQTWGYTSEEATYLRVPDVDPLFNDEAFNDLFLKAQERVLPTLETLHKRKDGKTYSVEVNVISLTLGSQPYLFAIARDISERKKYQDALKESEQRLRSMVEQAPVAIALTKGDDLVIETLNKPMQQIIGKGNPIDLSNKKLFDVLPELAEQPVIAMVKQVIESGKPFVENEVPVQSELEGNLETHYYNLSLTPIVEDNKVTNILHVALDVTEQVMNRKLVEESEEKYRTLFNRMDQGFCILEMIFDAGDQPIDYRFIEINPVFESQTGLKDAAGKTVKELVPNLEQHWFDLYGKVAITGEAIRFTEGSEAMGRWFEVFAFKLGGKESRKVALLFTDITARKQTEERIKRSEQNFRRMVQQAPVAMSILLGSTHVIEVANEKILDLWGKTAEAVMNKPVFEALPDAKEQGLEELLDHVYTAGETFIAAERPVQLLRKGKLETLYLNFVYEPYRDVDRNILGILAISIDVTEQVLARKKIEDSKEALQLAMEIAELGTFSINPQTQTIYCSHRVMKWFGFTTHEQQLESFYKTIHLKDRQRIRQAIQQSVLSEAHSKHDFTYQLADAPGQNSTFFRSIGKAIFNEEGVATQVRGVIQDVTAQVAYQQKIEQNEALLQQRVYERTLELEDLNQELKRSNVNLEEFAYAASHDMKEPIRKIHFFSDKLKHELHDKLTKEQQHLFSRVEHAARRMNTLIDDLLTYSHFSRGASNMEKLDLNKKVEIVLEDLVLETEQKQAVVTVDQLPVINGHRRQIQQLFQNLLTNALKYSKPDEKPVIHITASSIMGHEAPLTLKSGDDAKQFHKVTIRDNGIGFNKEDAERIFNVFTRLHGNTEYKGTGIGLSIAQKVVDNHHGYIWAEGEPGIGATFHILFSKEQGDAK